MIYDWFKRHREPFLMSARQAALAARSNQDKRVQALLDEAAECIKFAVDRGEQGVAFEHYSDTITTQALCAKLQGQGYKTQASIDPQGTYIAWVPVMAAESPK